MPSGAAAAPARFALGAALLLATAAGSALAQDAYPARVIRIVNSLSAGSSADRLNRVRKPSRYGSTRE
jgi:tripartite-type tricarboxylate transporter receptor subunit TctC